MNIKIEITQEELNELLEEEEEFIKFVQDWDIIKVIMDNGHDAIIMSPQSYEYMHRLIKHSV